jgi:hypothetical protein
MKRDEACQFFRALAHKPARVCCRMLKENKPST